jgi:hypothetical protein
MADAPNEVQCYAAFVQGNPAMGLPEQLHGETLFVLVAFYAGDIEAGRDALRPLREVGESIADTVQPTPYKEHQQSSDELYQEGHRNYWKSNFYNELSDAFVDTLMDYVDRLPSPFTTVFLEWMGGSHRGTRPRRDCLPAPQQGVLVYRCTEMG